MLQRTPAPPHLSSSIADSGPGEEDINQTDGERRGNVLVWTSGSTWQPAIIRPALSPHLHIYSLYMLQSTGLILIVYANSVLTRYSRCHAQNSVKHPSPPAESNSF